MAWGNGATEDRTGLRWEKTEDDYLIFHWGSMSLPSLSKRLGRSLWSIYGRTRTLALGPASRAFWSIRAVSRYSGFSEGKVKAAIEKLGLHGGWALSSSPRRHSKARTRMRALTDDHVDTIVKFMLENTYIFTDQAGASRSTRGVWGVGKKPAACVVCGRSDRPHEARGHCTTCYQKLFRKASTSKNPPHRLKWGQTVLSAEQVLSIRIRRHAGETMDALALEFGVTRQAISAIVKGRTWKHVGGPVEPYTYNNTIYRTTDVEPRPAS